MREILLTPQARAEIAEIRHYSRRRWGAAQPDRYLRGLGSRFRQIADGSATHRDAEIGDGYRRCRYEMHIIIFREEAGCVRILHVFHESMDIPGRLSAGE